MLNSVEHWHGADPCFRSIPKQKAKLQRPCHIPVRERDGTRGIGTLEPRRFLLGLPRLSDLFTLWKGGQSGGEKVSILLVADRSHCSSYYHFRFFFFPHRIHYFIFILSPSRSSSFSAIGIAVARMVGGGEAFHVDPIASPHQSSDITEGHESPKKRDFSLKRSGPCFMLTHFPPTLRPTV